MAAVPGVRAHLLDDLRRTEPLVQCLTNQVVVNFTANALLALGAAPAMVDIPEEAGAFASVASGVLVNLGTPHSEQRAAMLEAAEAARSHRVPWVLDPVAVGSLPVRTALARDLARLGPTVIRGNASEILALAGAGAGGRGVDSAVDSQTASGPARDLAMATGAVVAVSGAVDVVTDGARTALLHNGDAALTRITGGGCALGATIAAFLGLDEDPLEATLAAVSTYAVAAEDAAARSDGPGSFAVAFLDELARIDVATLARRAVRG